MPKFENDKECRVLLDWILSHDNLTVRDIHKHLIIMGFDFPYTLACSYAFFLSEFHVYRNNSNFERLLVCFQSMIIRQFMEIYDLYPLIDSSGLFGYSSSCRRDFE